MQITVDESTLPRIWKRGSVTRSKLPEKRDALILEYQEYARNLVGMFLRTMHLPISLFDDLLSAAHMGLVEAASRFDPGSGIDFKNYAYIRIHGSVIDAIREQGKVDGTTYRKLKALHAANELRENSQRAGSAIPVTLDDLLEFAQQGVMAIRLSLMDVEEEMSEDQSSVENPEGEHEKKIQRKLFKEILATFPENERLIIEGYYFNDKSFTEIADENPELSRSWISRLHQKALDRFAQELQKRQ